MKQEVKVIGTVNTDHPLARVHSGNAHICSYSSQSPESLFANETRT